jgi:WD40 repeat protein
VSFSPVGFPLVVNGSTSVVLPASLVEATSRSAVAFASGQAAVGTGATSAITLANGALKLMSISNLKMVAAVVLLLAAAAAGLSAIGVLADSAVKPASKAGAAAAPLGRTDLYGDALPVGAVVRLGSVRLRHAGLSSFVCLSDGKTVLTAGRDGILRFWDMDSGQQVRGLRLHGKAWPGREQTLSPDGKTLAAISMGKLVFWEIASGKEVKTLPAPFEAADVAFLCFSPDGQTLAVGAWNLQIALCEWQAGKERRISLPRWQVSDSRKRIG